MFESAEEFWQQIALGEDSLLELKRVERNGRQVVAPDSRVLADELSAMANGRGGVVVLGVDDRTRKPQAMSPAELSACVQKMTENGSTVDARIKSMMRDNPQMTQQQMAGVCNLSRSSIAMAITRLKKKGDIGRRGSDRRGEWEVYR